MYVIVDETTDYCGRHVANCLVGNLLSEKPGIPYLISCKVLEKTNSSSISRFINDSLQNILVDRKTGETNFYVLLSDAAPYMIATGDSLKVFYPRLIHVTCTIHGIHRISEVIRIYFANVNKLISSTKKVFLKAPLRIQAYKENLPDVPLPSEPVITRWSTWINAAIFYAENFDGIKEVIDQFDPDDSIAIKKSQDSFNDKVVERDLHFIKNYFSCIPETIIQLEKFGLELKDFRNF